jgi:hypothetical protein
MADDATAQDLIAGEGATDISALDQGTLPKAHCPILYFKSRRERLRQLDLFSLHYINTKTL